MRQCSNNRGEKNHKECWEIDWNIEGIHSLDPRTNESELEVQKIIIFAKYYK
jgi:hypothetical protein